MHDATLILGNQTSVDMQLEVGLLLLEKFEEKELDASVVFAITNLLQCGNLLSLGEKKGEEIVINLGAAKKAARRSAFKSAAKYVHSAVISLPADALTNNYDLTQELLSLGAEVEG